MYLKPLEIFLFFISMDLVRSYRIKVPVECEPHEVFAACKYSDQSTCSNPEASGYLECDGYCVCKSGYLRDNKGKCIPKEACSFSCPENSVFRQCSQKHNQRCSNIDKDGGDGSCRPGCACKPGYYWTETSNSCLKLKECLEAERKKTLPRIG